ncbi:MAG: ISAs1 family transposase [Clostridiales bacterium]|nr:ISAs1 family transposase [Clostridiales bacterium]
MDPRCGRKTLHDHAEILTCLIAGYLAGRNFIRRCLKWCENHEDYLKQHMELKNGIASPATVSRILGKIDEEMFCLSFIEWMTGILSTKGINIAIDGKALRGSMEKIKDRQAPYILNAIDTATALVIAQLPIAEKENEIPAIPKLLDLLNIQGSLITIDAIGTAQPVMDTIRKKGADYLLTVKKGNPLTYQETEEMFRELAKEKKQVTAHPEKTAVYEKQLASYEVFKTSEKNRSRMEYRTMQICHDTELITLCEKQPEIKTVGWLEQVRIPMEKDREGNDITPDYKEFLKRGTVRKPRITSGDMLTDEIHRVGIISSRKVSAQEALEIKRGHWKIENSLHHVLDDLFREDRLSARRNILKRKIVLSGYCMLIIDS